LYTAKVLYTEGLPEEKRNGTIIIQKGDRRSTVGDSDWPWEKEGKKAFGSCVEKAGEKEKKNGREDSLARANL